MTSNTDTQTIYWLQQQSNSAIVFIFLSICFVSLKLIATRIQVEDTKGPTPTINVALILTGLLTFLTLCALTIINARVYLAYYRSYNNPSQHVSYFIKIYKTNYAFSIVYPIACALPKLSICFLYLRLFNLQVWPSRISKVLIAFLVTNTIAWLLPSIAVCQPISQFWNPNGHQGHCIDYNLFGTWISLPHIISDMVMLVLPVPIVWKTQMKLAKKLGVISIFLVSSYGIIVACLRLASYVHRTYVTRPGTDETVKSIALDTMYSLFEAGSYLIAACLPSLHIVLIKLQGSLHRHCALLFQKRERRRTDEHHSLQHRQSPPLINVKLTGAGNLSTLAD